MELDPNFHAFIECCNAAKVRYLVIGGYAVIHHGHVRLTKDLDLWVEATLENGRRIVTALAAFGFGSLDCSAEDFARDNAVIRFGRPPLQIDVMTSAPGIDFAACHRRRDTAVVDGAAVSVISRDDLFAAKRAAGRPQDLADIDELTPRGDPAPDE